MKVYSEEQVRDAFKAGMSACMKHKDWALAINYPNKIELSEYMQSINSIELPSYEEIEQIAHACHPYAEQIGGDIYVAYRAFKQGLEIMRDKIQGGNK
jgi:hypothetical protein